jgi:hypothetical protein
MSVLITGIFMFVLGAISVALGGWIGFLALVAGFTLAWWAAARKGQFDKT